MLSSAVSYVWRVIVEAKVVVDDRVVYVVRLQQMLQRSGSLFCCRLNVVDLDRGQSDKGQVRAARTLRPKKRYLERR